MRKLFGLLLSVFMLTIFNANTHAKTFEDYIMDYFVLQTDCEVRAGPGFDYEIVDKAKAWAVYGISESFLMKRSLHSIDWIPLEEKIVPKSPIVDGWYYDGVGLAMTDRKAGETISFIMYVGGEEIIGEGVLRKKFSETKEIDGVLYNKGEFEVGKVQRHYCKWVRYDCGRLFSTCKDAYRYIGENYPQKEIGSLLIEGLDLEEQGKFEEALKIYRKILDISPGCAAGEHAYLRLRLELLHTGE